MSKNDGSESERICVARLKKQYGEKNVFIEKYTDTKQVKGKNLSGFVKASPADFIVTASGQMYYLEVKSCSNKTSFPFSQFTASQRRAMVRQKAAGGDYYVAIHNVLTDKWYFINAEQIIHQETSLNKKSITWKELEGYEWK